MPIRRDVVAGLATVPLVSLAASAMLPAWARADMTLRGDTIPTEDGDIVVRPIDHASLVLGFGGDTIYVDPVGGADLYRDLPPPTAILITHGHGDHFDIPTLQAIAGNAPIVTSQEVFDRLPETLGVNASAIANGEETSLNGLIVAAVPAHNVTEERLRYHPVGVGNGYVLTLGEKRVYVAGDTEPTDAMLRLRDIEIAFLPVNLPYTMTPEQAVEALNVLRPRIAYPYHYGDTDLSVIEQRIDPAVELRIANWYANGG